MKKYILAISAILLFGIAGLQAQSTGDISGTYFVPKGPSVVEIVRDGSGYKVTQISSTATKEQAHNGKVRAVIPNASAKPLAGTVNDFDSGKQYKATWEVTDGGQTLTMKVKVAFMSASYAWKKQPGAPQPVASRALEMRVSRSFAPHTAEHFLRCVGRSLGNASILMLIALLAGLAISNMEGQSPKLQNSYLQQSPEWQRGHFQNPQPTWSNIPKAVLHQVFGARVRATHPSQPIAVLYSQEGDADSCIFQKHAIYSIALSAPVILPLLSRVFT